MDPTRTNPALRLHSLMTKALTSECQGKPTLNAIRLMMGIQSDNDLDVYRAFAKLLALIDHAEASVKLLPADDAESFGHCFSPIRDALRNMQFGGTWSINGNTVRSVELGLLKQAGKALYEILPESQIAEAELSELKKGLEEFRKEVGTSDIPAQLKAILLRETTRIIDAIIDYKVTGAEGIREAAATAYGRAIVDREIIVPARENPVVQSFWTWVGRAGDVSQVAMTGNLLATNIVELLGKL